ncbi:SpoIIE family protein phosphatase [Streptomyces sp. NE5-10]|uniref:SpoIIE family protein phosphatase n=1 Tax=Streptomyces sp. NE5-10 TaxID=2759674 RepID=UPI0035AB912F
MRAAGGTTGAHPREPGVPRGLAGPADPRPGRWHGRLDEGDRVPFPTDGLVEARDAQGPFSPQETGSALLCGAPPAECAERLRGDVRDHAAHEGADDRALLPVEYAGGPAPGGGEPDVAVPRASPPAPTRAARSARCPTAPSWRTWRRAAAGLALTPPSDRSTPLTRVVHRSRRAARAGCPGG